MKFCPHCGYKIKRISKRGIILSTIFVLIVAAISLIAVFLPSWITAQEYNKGIDLLKAQSYQEAIVCFEKIISKTDAGSSNKFEDINSLLAFSNAKNTYLTTEDVKSKLTLSSEFLQEVPADYNGVLNDEIIEFKNSVESEFNTYKERQAKRLDYQKKKLAKSEARQEKIQNRKALYREIEECPLTITYNSLSFNAIDNPQVSVSVKNNSEKTIDAFTVCFYLYDNFNNPVNHYAYGNNKFIGISQSTINSGGTLSESSYYWTPYGHENTRKYKSFITEVHYTDNSTWSMSEGAMEYAKIYSDNEIENTNFK